MKLVVYVYLNTQGVVSDMVRCVSTSAAKGALEAVCVRVCY